MISRLNKNWPAQRALKTHGGITLFIFILVVFLSCAPSKDKSLSNAPGKTSSPAEKKIILPAFELPVPQNEQEKSYLGVTGSGTFTVSQINSPVLIIEVFNMYCPHCQRSAPLVNELYQTIQSRADVKGKIKIIGLGIGNSPYEVDLFKKKYEVPFPLFPDHDGAICKPFGVLSTPTFIGAKINRDGTIEQFYFKPGELHDIANFLTEIIQLSGLEQENK